jgi:hypothetical protein
MENTDTNNESLKGVRILRSYYEALDEFTYEEKGRMFEAIMEYGLNGAEPNFDGAEDARALRGIWKTYLPVINNSINRAIASAKNGNKGGAPKKINDGVEPSKPSTQNKAIESTIISQPIPEVQVEVMVPQNEDKAPIKASDIPRPPIQLVKVETNVPVIENKVDLIDLSKFNLDDLRAYDKKYTYENNKVTANNYFEIINNLNRNRITFQQMLIECDEMILIQQKIKADKIASEELKEII